MIKLYCPSCNHFWFTSNTSKGQYCDKCKGIVAEVDMKITLEEAKKKCK